MALVINAPTTSKVLLSPSSPTIPESSTSNSTLIDGATFGTFNPAFQSSNRTPSMASLLLPLCGVLQILSELQVLDLAGNQLGDDGAASIADYVFQSGLEANIDSESVYYCRWTTHLLGSP
eukprot:Filipodium_phascolosomae@DN8772_c0_g1_i1.p1